MKELILYFYEKDKMLAKAYQEWANDPNEWKDVKEEY